MLNDLCFEIIQKCTNNCMFCSSNSTMKATNFIDYELFKRVIDHIMNNGGLSEISISGGETFLHKDLLKMVKLCKSYNIKTNVYTSGIIENSLKTKEINPKDYTYIENKILEQLRELDYSAIDKERLFALKEAGLDKIVFDFQLAEYDNYNKLMGTKDNLSNLLSSMVRAKSVGLYTEVHFIPMKTNYQDIEDVLEICDIGEIDRISILKFVPQGRGRKNKQELALSDIELKEFCENIQLLRKKYKTNIRLGIPITKENQHLCTAGHDKLSIRHDGMVLPCVAFKEMDSKELMRIFKRKGIDFKTFSIKNRLDMLISNSESNKYPICRQVYCD